MAVRVAARFVTYRHSGSLAFKLEVESASHIVASAAAVSQNASGFGFAKDFKSKLIYNQRAAPTLCSEFNYSIMRQVPAIERILVRCHFRLDRRVASFCESTMRDLRIFTGQQPMIIQATYPVLNTSYKLGDLVGCKVTLTGEQLLYPFMDKLLNLVVKSRDLQGLVTYGVSGIAAPSKEEESRFENVDPKLGLKVVLVTDADTRMEARRLLVLMGLPYQGVLRLRQSDFGD